MADKTGSSEVFSSIFGTHTQGLSLFANNVFRRPKSLRPEVGPVDLTSSVNSLASKEGAPFRTSEAEKEERKKTKRKEKLDYVSSESLSFHDRAYWQDNLPVAGEKQNLVDGPFAAEGISAKKVKGLHSSHTVVQTGKDKQQVDYHTELTNAESRVKHGKRTNQDVLEQQKPIKRQKTSSSDGSGVCNSTQDSKSGEGGSERAKKITKRKKDGSSPDEKITKRKKDGSSPDAKSGKKLRKLEYSVESSYEGKLRGTGAILPINEDPRPPLEDQEEGKSKSKVKGAVSGKRKRTKGDGQAVEQTSSQSFDAEEKLKRTIFVGNLPLTVKKKALIKEFSVYGPVESVRLRSVPLLDTKTPRRGAIITGQINEAVDSQHAYVVFENIAYANAALAHNMKEFCGNHLRVDIAYAPRQTMKGKSSLQYDLKRSIFVGNIPFDVKDEEMYQTFGTRKSPEMEVEAVRVVRDPQTSVSKGIAYVLFKTKAGARSFLSTKRRVKLRDRILRIDRVVSSQAKHQQQTPSKHTKRVADLSNSQLERKRAKLSASYEGIRATKESVHLGREKHKAAGSKQHIGRSPRSRGGASAIGTKRKRMERQQRGISRSKKIRRT